MLFQQVPRLIPCAGLVVLGHTWILATNTSPAEQTYLPLPACCNEVVTMRRLLLLMFMFGQSVRAQSAAPPIDREFRAIWVATVGNIDWPSKPGLSTWDQQRELLTILDRAVALKLNAIIFQVRPGADALYDSPYEPWSQFLTGRQGRAPEPAWDPLAFAVEQAHKRGLELHAWFNPYRAAYSLDTVEARTHVSRTNPELVWQYDHYLWMDPGDAA